MMTAGQGLHAEVFSDLSDTRLVAAWRALSCDATRMDPFSTNWWCGAGREFHEAVEPCIVVAYDSDRPVALAALGLKSGRDGLTLVPYATAHRDLVDVLAFEPDEPRMAALCDALPWARISQVAIDGIPEDSPLGPGLEGACRRHGLHGVMYGNNGEPELSLVDDRGDRHATYRGIMRGKTSKQMRKKIHRLGDIHYVKADRCEKIPELMSAVFALHQKRWHGTTSPSGYGSPRSRSHAMMIAEMAFDSGALHLAVLYADGRPIGGALGYLLETTYYFHIVAVDMALRNFSPLRTFQSFILDDLLQNTNVTRFDYLAGEEPYKLRHASRVRVLLRLRMTRSRGRAVLLVCGATVEKWLRKRPHALAFARRVKHGRARTKQTVRRLRAKVHGHYIRHGFFRCVLKAIATLGNKVWDRRSMVVMVRPVAPMESDGDIVAIRRGTLADCNHVAHRKNDPSCDDLLTTFFRRTKQHARYYVACMNGQIIGSAWIQIGQEYAPCELNRELIVCSGEEHDAFLMDAWTAPEHRGKRVYATLVRGIIGDLAAESGCECLVAAIDTRNRASIRAHVHAGYHPSEDLEVTRLFGRTIGKKRTARAEN